MSERQPKPLVEIVGFRNLETGDLIRVTDGEPDVGPLDMRWWEPVFTGGPQLAAPLLAVLIDLAEDRTEGNEARSGRFLDHRFEAQRALGEFVRLGGEIP